MLEDLRGARTRLLALLAVLALALGATACGSDDDGGSDAQAGGGDSASDSPKEQISADYDKFIDDIYEGRYAEACKGYSAKYLKFYPKHIKIADTCIKTMQAEFKTVSLQPRPWVDRVEVKGPNRAIGFTKTAKDDAGNPIKFVEVNGTWKLDGPALEEYAPGNRG